MQLIFMCEVAENNFRILKMLSAKKHRLQMIPVGLFIILPVFWVTIDLSTREAHVAKPHRIHAILPFHVLVKPCVFHSVTVPILC